MDKFYNTGEKWRYLYLVGMFIKRDVRPEDFIINWIKCPILGHLSDTLPGYLCPFLDYSDRVYAKAEQREPSLRKFGVATAVGPAKSKHQHWVRRMVLFLSMIDQLPCEGLNTKYCFPHQRTSFFLEELFTLNVDLPSLQIVFSPKLPSTY